jgi:hypothetical protein
MLLSLLSIELKIIGIFIGAIPATSNNKKSGFL